MNNRIPILIMLVAGATVIIGLSVWPAVIAVRPFAVSSMPEYMISSPAEEQGAQHGYYSPEFDAAAWYVEHGEAPETHGVLVESFDHGTVLASHNADLDFNPASLIKLSTSLVALSTLGAEYRFETRVFVDGQVDGYGTLDGGVYVLGQDPTFGDVGASMIARELRSRGIRRIVNPVIVSPDFCFNFSNSPDESARRLVNALHLGKMTTGISSVANGKFLFSVTSDPLRDVLLYMNARSSNFIAERLGALVGGPEVVRQFLIDRVGLPPDQVSIARTSGREHNRMTPRGLVAVIRALLEESTKQGIKPTDIMPVASDDSGTLHRRLAGTGLEGSVVGKTGTLTSEVDGGMASLAGIVYTNDAEPLVFAILDQGNKIADNRQREDQLLAEIVRSRSTPRTIASPTPRRLLPSVNMRVQTGNSLSN